MTRIPTCTPHGDSPVYVARPDGTPSAAVIAIPENLGGNAGMRAKCNSWAATGYLAAAPDTLWRFAEGEKPYSDVPEQLQRALANMDRFSEDDFVKDIEALSRAFYRELRCAMTYRAASRTQADATVRYRVVSIDENRGELSAIAKPQMRHNPTSNHFVMTASFADLEPKARSPQLP